MATWIKPGDIGADDYIATFGVGSTGTAFGINFETVGGAFRAFIWGSSTPGIVAETGSGAVAKDEWVHIAATFISASGSIHLYIDNKLAAIGTGTTITSISASGPLILGARNSGGNIERHANFTMANFRLFNRALTSDEIYQLYAYQKEYFGHGDLSMTLKAGRLGIGTSEPRAALDVRGDIYGGCPVFFHATRTAGHLNSATNPIVFNNVVSSKGGGYNSSTGKFTCPIAGYYKIYGYAITDTGGTVWMVLRINDIDQGFGKAYSHTPSPNHTQAHATSIVYLNHNDTVHYRSQGSISGSGTTSNQASANGFIVHYFSS
jgi:hypothetical protein